MENYSNLKFDFMRTVNSILNEMEHSNNIEIKNREIEIGRYKLKIINDKFKLIVGIKSDFKCSIFCKEQDYIVVIAILSILMAVNIYFQKIMQDEIDKRSNKNEL